MRYPPEDRMVRAYQATIRDKVVNIAGWPHVVLQDTDDLVALYMPEGTPLWRWNVEERRLRPTRITRGDSVRLFFPGKPFEVSLFYATASEPAPWVRYYFSGWQSRPDDTHAPEPVGRFYGWKVDLTSPFARTEIGFDMIDEVLDIVVRPDRSYEWRDEDETSLLIEVGVYSEKEAEALRIIGRDVIDLIETRTYPFDDTWISWRSTPDLILGEIPAGWQDLPVPAPYRTYEGPLS